jgi:hypothetical protein
MTLYGVDVSNNNDGGSNTIDLNEIKIENFTWIEAKVSQGSSYRDPDWERIKQFGASTGTAVIGYHYVDNSDPAAQAQTWLANDGGPNAMLDFENEPDLTYIDQFWAVFNAFKDAGVTVRLSYIPHWYWQNIGAPDISTVPGLIASNYVTGTGYASSIYPGDNSNRWFSYGGATPQILQFSSQAIVANLQACDVNAFRGTPDQLYELLGLEAPTTGVFMALTDAQQDQLLAAVLDIQTQLRGPGLTGWPQNGKNPAGQNLTEVDAIAEVKTEVEAIEQAVVPAKAEESK